MNALNKFSDVVRLGLHGVIVHKVRSALTILGILFGVWSVIAMLAINAGLSEESQKALRQLGSANIIIDSIKPESDESKASQSRGALIYGLTNADVRQLRSNVPQVSHCAIMHKTIKKASAGQKRRTVAVIGVEPNYAEVARAKLFRGRFICSPDMLLRRNVCVIPQSLARKLFAYHDPIGQMIHLVDTASKPFTVVGILETVPQALFNHAGEAGDCVIVPMATSMMQFGKMTSTYSKGSRSMEQVEVSQCILQMENETAVLRGAPVVRSLLSRQHTNQDYEVRVPVEEIQLMKKDRRRWNFMFFMIASVSLLVGGIGIMNIMLASVTERTREIGVRRALGAKRRDIVVQFLVESVTLTAIGGLLGIAIGLLIPWLVQEGLGFTTKVTPITLILPFVMAVVVGLISGLYPATRAAKLDPIEALRHE